MAASASDASHPLAKDAKAVPSTSSSDAATPENEAAMRQLSASIHDEMMVAMLDTLQVAAAACAEVTVQRLQSLRQEMLQKFEEAEAQKSRRRAGSTDSEEGKPSEAVEYVRRTTSFYELFVDEAVACENELPATSDGKDGLVPMVSRKSKRNSSCEAMYDYLDKLASELPGRRPSLAVQRQASLRGWYDGAEGGAQTNGVGPSHAASSRAKVLASESEMQAQSVTRIEELEAELRALKYSRGEAEMQRELKEVCRAHERTAKSSQALAEEMRASLTGLSWQLSGMWEMMLQGSSVPTPASTARANLAPARTGGRATSSRAAQRGIAFQERDHVEEVEVPVAAAKLRSSRGRQATAFVAMPAKGGGIEFVEDDSESEVELEAANGARLRPVKTRQATAFVARREDDEEDEDGRGGRRVGFKGPSVQEIELQEMEFEMQEAGQRKLKSTKSRQATAFVGAGASFNEEGVSFAEEDSESEHEAAGGAPLRSAKKRQPTAFVRKAGPSGVQWDDDASESDREVDEEAGVAPLRPAKTRQATAFVPKSRAKFAEDDDDAPQEKKGSTKSRRVNFRRGDSVEQFNVVEDIEMEPEVNLRPTKTRQATAFVKPAARGGAGVQFAEDDAAVLEQEVEGDVPLKKVRTRQATAFVPKQRAKVQMAEEDDEDASPAEGKRHVGFQQRESIHEIEYDEEEAPRQMKSSRARQATAFAPKPRVQVAEDDDDDEGPARKVNFRPRESVVAIPSLHDGDEEEQPKQKRSAKGRQATAFVKVPMKGGGVQFVELEVVEAYELEEAQAPLKSSRTRQATAFVPKSKAPREAVQFADDAEEDVEEVEIAAGASAKSVRTRQATAFVPKSKVAASAIQFEEDVDVEEQELEESAASMKSSRARQATAFVSKKQAKEADAAEGGRGHVGFRGHDSIVALDEDPLGANTKSVKGRQQTAFMPKGAHGAEVQFAAEDEVVEMEATASGEGKRALKSTKTRQATAFVSKAKLKEGVSFEEEVDESEHELHEDEAPKQLRPSRSRQATSFVPKGGIVAFADEVSESDEGPEMAREESHRDLRPCRRRQPTAFARPQMDSMVSFSTDQTEESEHEIEEENVLRPARQRQPTAFVGRKDTVSDGEEEDDDDEDDGAGVSAGASVRKCRSEAAQGSRSLVMQHCRSDESGAGGGRSSFTGRAYRTRLPTHFDGVKRGSLTDQDLQALLAEGTAAAEGGVAAAPAAPAEVIPPDIMHHVVAGATKDLKLIEDALKALYFFADLHEEGRHALAQGMEVFDFPDGADVCRQGNKQGSHFFIVESGAFVVIKNGENKCEITPGQAFGESVILLSGAQSATVRATGSNCRAYGMRGITVRKILQQQYEEEHKEVVEAVNDTLNSEQCGLLHKLTPYQVQSLYDKGRTQSFGSGEVLIQEGAKDCNVLYVVLKGAVSIALAGNEIIRLGPNDVVGDSAVLFQEAPFEATAVDGTVQTLMMERSLLVDMFGEKLEHVLLKSRLFGVLQQFDAFSRQGVEFLDTVAGLARITEIPAGGSMEQARASFAVCVHGNVQAEAESTDPGNRSVPEAARLCGKAGDALGLENLTQGGIWTLKATALDDAPATVVVWCGEGLAGMLRRRVRKSTIDSSRSNDGQGTISLSTSVADLRRRYTIGDRGRSASMKLACASGDKFGALKKVIVLRTLTTEQLAMLAASMEVSYLTSGEDLFRQGDPGHEFIIIHSGQVEIKVNGKRIRTLGMGDYLGERALLFDEPRSATVTATEDCELWKMGKDIFEQVVKGPIRDYMKDRISFQNTRIDLTDLECIRIVGRGGFGLVKMVCQKSQNGATAQTRYALKCVSKRHAIEHKQAEALVVERSIMAELDHPFVYKYIRSYQGPRYVYFLTELVTGGELIDVLDVLGCLKRPQAQFYLGSIALALEFLHERRIAYLDLKGENCLIDQHGYLKVIDFGIAERVKTGRLHVVKGTPLFMAPEVVLGKGYTTSADLWSLGVVLYDFMLGTFPFASDTASQTEIFRAVLRQPLKFPKSPKLEECSKSIMTLLLNREPEKRPGAGPEGYAALKEHAFFAGFNWDGLVARQLTPPFVPQKETYAEDADDRPPGQVDIESTSAKCTDDFEGPDFVDPNPSLWEDF
eukprot:TRINITY_DN91501_c0_g1_i1.p1 TRINITY_DN91501_c0_g1~~TRINITY_DN91501_c0_g1_i1.p1  ORF type:complete len:2121 (+),score=667.37 TRINITY_DN91501_c0_g1_i1:86-6448(+)